jgi:hypothetical protein
MEPADLRRNSSLHKIAQGAEIAELDAEIARLGGY